MKWEREQGGIKKAPQIKIQHQTAPHVRTIARETLTGISPAVLMMYNKQDLNILTSNLNKKKTNFQAKDVKEIPGALIPWRNNHEKTTTCTTASLA